MFRDASSKGDSLARAMAEQLEAKVVLPISPVLLIAKGSVLVHFLTFERLKEVWTQSVPS